MVQLQALAAARPLLKRSQFARNTKSDLRPSGVCAERSSPWVKSHVVWLVTFPRKKGSADLREPLVPSPRRNKPQPASQKQWEIVVQSPQCVNPQPRKLEAVRLVTRVAAREQRILPQLNLLKNLAAALKVQVLKEVAVSEIKISLSNIL